MRYISHCIDRLVELHDGKVSYAKWDGMPSTMDAVAVLAATMAILSGVSILARGTADFLYDWTNCFPLAVGGAFLFAFLLSPKSFGKLMRSFAIDHSSQPGYEDGSDTDKAHASHDIAER